MDYRLVGYEQIAERLSMVNKLLTYLLTYLLRADRTVDFRWTSVTLAYPGVSDRPIFFRYIYFYIYIYNHYQKSKISTVLHNSGERERYSTLLSRERLDCSDELPRLEECLLELRAWFWVNELASNSIITDAIIVDVHKRLQMFNSINSINIIYKNTYAQCWRVLLPKFAQHTSNLYRKKYARPTYKFARPYDPTYAQPHGRRTPNRMTRQLCR